MRIEIAGALSCGKSTLADMLASQGHKIVYEDLSTNPYLDLRVDDPETYSFPCQRQFVLDKISSMKKAEAEALPYICDFSIAAEHAYVTLYSAGRSEWLDPLLKLLDEREPEIGQADLVVHLRCSPKEQLNRIRIRGRDFEQGHDIAFISMLNALVDAEVARIRNKSVDVVEYWTDRTSWEDVMLDLRTNHLPRLGFSAKAFAA